MSKGQTKKPILVYLSWKIDKPVGQAIMRRVEEGALDAKELARFNTKNKQLINHFITEEEDEYVIEISVGSKRQAKKIGDRILTVLLNEIERKLNTLLKLLLKYLDPEYVYSEIFRNFIEYTEWLREFENIVVSEIEEAFQKPKKLKAPKLNFGLTLSLE